MNIEDLNYEWEQLLIGLLPNLSPTSPSLALVESVICAAAKTPFEVGENRERRRGRLK